MPLQDVFRHTRGALPRERHPTPVALESGQVLPNGLALPRPGAGPVSNEGPRRRLPVLLPDAVVEVQRARVHEGDGREAILALACRLVRRAGGLVGRPLDDASFGEPNRKDGTVVEARRGRG